MATSFTAGLIKIFGQKIVDVIVPFIFIVAIFFLAKMVVERITGWSKEDILQNQLENRASVIEVMKEVAKESASEAKKLESGVDVQQKQAVETIERLDAVQAQQVLRQVGVEVTGAKAQQAAEHHAEAIKKADPTKPVPSTAEFSSPLSPEDLEFIRASNKAVNDAYASAVSYSQ